MSTRLKYRVGAGALRAMFVLKDNPGLSATELAPLLFPNLRVGGGKMKPVLKTAQWLRSWKRRGYVDIKYSGNPFKERAWCLYYLSDYGYEICEYYRNLQTNN